MPKIFAYRGKKLEELKQISIEEFSRLLTSRDRRKIRRGLTEQEKKLLENIRKNPKKFHKTHLRDMMIFPDMVGVKIGIYIGGGVKEREGERWATVAIAPEMIGNRLGDFAMTNKRVKHSSPGLGATRGSKHIPLK
ncbi:30S ribosomal protein S19 [archaeon]|nr:30S ribosomal protein S19 [archaeon]